MEAIKLIKGLGQVCEYAYRKGVVDSATSGDIGLISEIVEQEDGYSTFQFLIDEDSEVIKFEHYLDYVALFCRLVNAPELRNFLIYRIGEGNMKRSICTAVNYWYRVGLKEGMTTSRSDAIDFFKSVKKGTKHHRLDGTMSSHSDWIEEVKHSINKIHNIKRRLGMNSSMNQLSIFIGRSLIAYKN